MEETRDAPEAPVIEIRCDNCEIPFEVDDELAGGKVPCPECGDVNRIPEPAEVDDEPVPPDRDGAETDVYYVRPAMARAHPFRFLVILVAIMGGLILSGAAMFSASVPQWLAWVGVILAAAGLVWWTVWWVQDRLTARLRVTTKRTIHRVGLLRKNTSEVLHQHIRNIRIEQKFIERIFNVGSIKIDSSAGGQDDEEIYMEGIPDPERLRKTIDQYRQL